VNEKRCARCSARMPTNGVDLGWTWLRAEGWACPDDLDEGERWMAAAEACEAQAQLKLAKAETTPHDEVELEMRTGAAWRLLRAEHYRGMARRARRGDS
jgi:hypothetical protein